MEEGEVLELYELHYSDLMAMSSDLTAHPNQLNHDLSTPSPEERRRLETVRRSVMETLGPTGSGLLSITGVPNASLLRRRLLPLARKLALLDNDQRKRILKECGLGSDVPLKNPDRKVSSFAMQLKYTEFLESGQAIYTPCSFARTDLDADHSCLDSVSGDDDYKNLGHRMMQLGLCLAQVCDKAIGGKELEKSLLESGTAKGRLIHYHSALDNVLGKETARRNLGSSRKMGNAKTSKGYPLLSADSAFVENGSHEKLWQQWHYDYGIFTVLTAPMFLVPSHLSENGITSQLPSVTYAEECSYPGGNSYLQVFHPNNNAVVMVKASPESFIVQVGESADIISKGKLRPTLHCVTRPEKMDYLSRETFVVFLQPSWSKTFSLSGYNGSQRSCLDDRWSGEENGSSRPGSKDLKEHIHKMVPPLSSRLKDGMTFAEFARETTKRYYGGGGLQSNS
ncbi:unnamed protein product [Linum tenue]|uniref:Isopenicillin N synthase-like Fe(2+) 2OG dioxygenase domain-containing protein n=1 Tax=Linum tenue TaxID=586396 RepID=A0AAV0LJL8_9ROSI|nr:unnamed protein product [Linum tenue]